MFIVGRQSSLGGGCRTTIIVKWARITNNSTVGDVTGNLRRYGSMCLTRDEVQRTRSRGPKGRAKGIIAHGKMLSVIPQRRHSIPIIVIHDNTFVCATPARYRLDKLVHLALIKCLLLSSITMILVTGHNIGKDVTIQTLRIG